MASTRFNVLRSEIAVLVRYHPDDPRIPALQEELKGALVVQRIGRVLDKAEAPITPELRTEIEQLLASRVVVAA